MPPAGIGPPAGTQGRGTQGRRCAAPHVGIQAWHDTGRAGRGMGHLTEAAAVDTSTVCDDRDEHSRRTMRASYGCVRACGCAPACLHACVPA